MSTYLTARTQRVVAERMAEDYLHHGASIRVLMFQEGLSYGAVHRLLTQVAGVRLRGRGGPANHTELRGEFDDLDDDRAARTVGGLATVLAASRPDLEISPEVRHGSPADVLVELSAHARLVVVGSRGRAPVAATLLGSVSAKVATHARCPAVVVRGHPRTGQVVVGLDGSPSSGDALEFAFDAAERYGTELLAVHVWRDPEYAPVVPRLPYETADLRESAHRTLAE